MKACMMERLSTYLPVALFALFCSSHALATPIRDQGQISGTGGRVSIGTDTSSQSITAGIAGQLTGIQIQFESFPAAAPLLDLSILDGGNPPGASTLFSQQLNLESGDLEGHVFTWELTSANLFFDVGDQFTLTLSAQPPGFFIAGNDPPGYAGGELFLNGLALPSSFVNDIAFITFVDPDAMPIPEPAALPLLAIGLLGLIIFGRRRDRSRRSRGN